MNTSRILLTSLTLLSFAAACGGEEPTPTTSAPKITSTAVTAAKVGEAYSYTIVATGSPLPQVAVTTKPAWLTLDGRLLSGTPGAADVGDAQVTIVAANGISPDATQTFTITVSPADTETAPTITSTPVTTAAVGVAYSYTVAATGNPTPTFAATGEAGGALPGWLTFDVSTGVLTGTPVVGDVGDHKVEITATNGVDPDATQTFTITVAENGEAPTFTSTPVTDATEGQAYSYTVTTSGVPAATVTATLLPSWLTFSGGVLSGTPAAADVGDHDVTLTAANGVNPDATQSFTITVAATAQTAPSFTSTPVTTATEGQAYSYTATADGTPAPTLSAVTLPAWLSFDPATGVLSGTPTLADVGSSSVALAASNGVSPDATQAFTIVVSAAPLQIAPTFTSTPATSGVVGTTYSYTVTAAGTPTPVITATVLPAWLIFDAATGLISGVPAATDVGPNMVELTAVNGVSPAATQTFSIEVVDVTSAPAIVSTPVTAARAGQAYSYTVVATGVPTPTLTAMLNGGGALPAWLTFDPATGVLSGTPAATDVGNYDVIITASNGVNPDAMQAFTITVGGPAGIPVAGNPYLQTFTGGLPADWVATGQWAVGAPTTGAASVGPPSVFDGDLAATNLTGNYTSSAHWNLDTPAFDFTGVASPQLRFVHWHNFERATSGTPPNNYDGGNIKISTDNGTTWVELDPASVTPAYQGVLVSGNSMPGQQAWSGILTDWTRVSIDLTTALTGQPLDQVKFRFDFGSDSSVTRPGWYVDNVRVGDAAQIPSSPVITSVPPAQLSIVAGELFTYVVTATGNPTPQLTATSTSGALPAWLTFDPATGVLTGTPANADAGLESIVITATNGQTPDAVQQFTLDVLPIEALATYIFDGDVRTPDVVATDVTAGELNNRAGTTTFVTGNPGRALNSNGFNVAVDPNYYEFVITPAAGFQVALDAFAFDHYRSSTGPTSFQVLIVSGGVTSTVTAGAGTMPTATTWTTATIPLAGAERGPFTGPVAVRITASGASSATGTFRIDNVSLAGVVQPRPNSAPVILSSPATVAQIGTPYSYPIVVDGWPAPTVTVSGLPTWLTYNSTTRTISGNPSVLSVGTSGTITVTAANTITPNATQTFTVTVAAPAAVPVIDGSPMTQNFSATLPTGWGATGGWEFGIPTVGANTVGPPTVYDGEVAATRIAANYTNSSFWSMATEIYDLSAVTNPTLQFVHWYNFERSASGTNYDGANIKISTDGGASWVELLPASVTPAYTGALGSGTTGMAGQQGWSGILTDWQIVTVDLSANLTGLRDQVAIRFDMGSDSSTTRPGWYVDDVRIGALADLVIAPTVTSAPRLSGMEGAAYSYSVTATGLPAPTLAATGAAGAALPAWLTFNPATGILSGTPGATDVGDHAVDVTATNAGGVDTQSFSIHVFAAGTLPVFTDGFEGPANPWTIGFDVGTASDWEIGTATVAGPLGCFAGAQCAGTILDGDYSVGPALSYMQTPVVNLTGIPQPAMRFMQWYRTESGYDGGNVKISTDGGLTFSPLTPSSVTPAYTGTLSPAPMAGQLAWTGVGTTWTAVTIDLSADLQGLPRDQIVLRFDFASDTSLVYTGWYLDDVQVGDYATLQ